MEHDERLERVLREVDPAKRSFLKSLVIGSAFAVPTVASFSVPELASAQTNSIITTTITVSEF